MTFINMSLPQRVHFNVTADCIVTDLRRHVKQQQNFSSAKRFVFHKRFSLKPTQILSLFHEKQNNCENIKISSCSFIMKHVKYVRF